MPPTIAASESLFIEFLEHIHTVFVISQSDNMCGCR